MSKRIFVTGSTGLLGSHLLYDLVKLGHEVNALYRSDSSLEKSMKVLKYYDPNLDLNKINWQKGSIEDVDLLQELLVGIDEVYHCAALVSFDPADANLLFKVNVQGTQNVLNASLECGVKKFLHVSSTAAIGFGDEKKLINEEVEWDNSLDHSFYAKSKYSAEREVWRAIEEGLNAVIINPCVILGPGDPDQSSGSIFATMSKGLKFYTQGGNAFVDARDVSKAMVELMESDICSERFLCISENRTFKSLFDEIADQMKMKRPSIHAKKWMTEIAWRMIWIGSKLSRSKAFITSESARASHHFKKYSNDKLKSYIPIEFRTVDDAIENSVNYLRSIEAL